jgi:hypothetical protein
MSKPCRCGASKTMRGCKPCRRAQKLEQRRAYYWQHEAQFKSRKRGRPAKTEIRASNKKAIDFLRVSLRHP